MYWNIHSFLHSVYWMPVSTSWPWRWLQEAKPRSLSSQKVHSLVHPCVTLWTINAVSRFGWHWLGPLDFLGTPPFPLLAWNRSFLPNTMYKEQESSYLCVTTSPLAKAAIRVHGRRKQPCIQCWHVGRGGGWVDGAEARGCAVVSDTGPGSGQWEALPPSTPRSHAVFLCCA